MIVNTGKGEGKTTAALGILLRARGRNLRVGGVQCFKHESVSCSELKALAKMGIELTPMGDGFTWTSKDLDATQAKALHGWEVAQQKVASGDYDMFLLDEFTYVMHFGWVSAEAVVAWLRGHKPPTTHVIITGRDAPEALIEFADLVTEMRKVKHLMTPSYAMFLIEHRAAYFDIRDIFLSRLSNLLAPRMSPS